MQTNNEYIKQILAEKEIALIGFADLSEIDETIRRGFKYGISIAVALKVFPGMSEATAEYFNEYKRVSSVLKDASNYLADKIREYGYDAFSLAGERQNEQFRTQLPYKTLATRSGIGWIGKSAALVTKEYGNAIRLNGVLTDMPLETGKPINASECGDCGECVKYCPGKAIKGNLWDMHSDRDDLLDAFACKKTVIERGKTLGVTEGSCGICIRVCPWTKRYIDAWFS